MYYLHSYRLITIVIISPLILLLVYKFGRRYISLHVSSTTRSLPVHINYTSNYRNLSILLKMFWEFLVSPEIFIAIRSNIKSLSQFCFLRIVSFFNYVSSCTQGCLKLICSVTFLTVSIFLSYIFQLIWGNLLINTIIIIFNIILWFLLSYRVNY
jgi:hypothetical protein